MKKSARSTSTASTRPPNRLRALSPSSILRSRESSVSSVRRFASGSQRRSNRSTTTTIFWRSAFAPPKELLTAWFRWLHRPRVSRSRSTYGPSLPDPAGILQGSGNQNRFVRLKVRRPWRTLDVQTLLAAAAAQAKSPLPASGGGYTMIKSISAKQRPRRLPQK